MYSFHYFIFISFLFFMSCSTSNEDLRNMGLSLTYYPGIPNFFNELSNIIEIQKYQEYAIEIEYYVITSGLREILEGSNIKPYVKTIFGSEYDEGESGKLQFPKRAIGHTQKTQVIQACACHSKMM